MSMPPRPIPTGSSALDAFTGRLVWEREGVEVIHLLGVAKGRLIVTFGGQTRGIRGLNLRTGADSGAGGWTIQNDGGVQTFGRGLVAEDVVVWPTMHGLQFLDPADGTQLRLPIPGPVLRLPDGTALPSATPGPFGNLCYADGVLLVTTATEVWGYVSEAKKLGDRRRAVEDGPDHPVLHADLAQSLIDAGEYGEAEKETAKAGDATGRLRWLLAEKIFRDGGRERARRLYEELAKGKGSFAAAGAVRLAAMTEDSAETLHAWRAVFASPGTIRDENGVPCRHGRMPRFTRANCSRCGALRLRAMTRPAMSARRLLSRCGSASGRRTATSTSRPSAFFFPHNTGSLPREPVFTSFQATTCAAAVRPARVGLVRRDAFDGRRPDYPAFPVCGRRASPMGTGLPPGRPDYLAPRPARDPGRLGERRSPEPGGDPTRYGVCRVYLCRESGPIGTVRGDGRCRGRGRRAVGRGMSMLFGCRRHCPDSGRADVGSAARVAVREYTRAPASPGWSRRLPSATATTSSPTTAPSSSSTRRPARSSLVTRFPGPTASPASCRDFASIRATPPFHRTQPRRRGRSPADRWAEAHLERAPIFVGRALDDVAFLDDRFFTTADGTARRHSWKDGERVWEIPLPDRPHTTMEAHDLAAGIARPSGRGAPAQPRLRRVGEFRRAGWNRAGLLRAVSKSYDVWTARELPVLVIDPADGRLIQRLTFPAAGPAAGIAVTPKGVVVVTGRGSWTLAVKMNQGPMTKTQGMSIIRVTSGVGQRDWSLPGSWSCEDWSFQSELARTPRTAYRC